MSWWLAESGPDGENLPVTSDLDFRVRQVLRSTAHARVQYLGDVLAGAPDRYGSEAKMSVSFDGSYAATTYVTVCRRQVGDATYTTIWFPHQDLDVSEVSVITMRTRPEADR